MNLNELNTLFDAACSAQQRANSEDVSLWSCRGAGLKAAVEALEGEVADAELRGERAYEYGKKRQAELIAALDAAEARAGRLRDELQIVLDEFGYSLPPDTKASITAAIRAAAGGGE